MAFTPDTLAHLAGNTQGVTPNLWGYKTSDNIADLDDANYWAGANLRNLRAGDMVLASCGNGAAIVTVSAVSSTTSTAAIMTA